METSISTETGVKSTQAGAAPLTVIQEGKDDCGLAVAKRAFLSKKRALPKYLAAQLGITTHQGTDNETLAQVLGKYSKCEAKIGTTIEEIQAAIQKDVTVIVNILHLYENGSDDPEKENPFAEGFCQTNPAGWDLSLGNPILWDGHYVTVISVDNGKVIYADPQDGQNHEISIPEFKKLWRAYYNELAAWALFVEEPIEEFDTYGHAA
jgi:hypothetical protein